MTLIDFFLGMTGTLIVGLLGAIAKIAWDTQQIVTKMVEQHNTHNEKINDHEERIRVLENE
jgi:hypothetical protein